MTGYTVMTSTFLIREEMAIDFEQWNVRPCFYIFTLHYFGKLHIFKLPKFIVACIGYYIADPPWTKTCLENKAIDKESDI